MKTRLTVIVLLFIFTIGCSSPTDVPHQSVWEVELIGAGDSELNRLDTNDDGWYVLPLNMSKLQTVHRLFGRVTQDGERPERPQKVGWDSSHIWILAAGDTLGYIIRRTINADGQWVNLDTLYNVAFRDEPVPTVNPVSYTHSNENNPERWGEFNGMIAPIRDMRGDTLTVRAYIRKGGTEFDDIIRIILQ